MTSGSLNQMLKPVSADLLSTRAEGVLCSWVTNFTNGPYGTWVKLQVSCSHPSLSPPAFRVLVEDQK